MSTTNPNHAALQTENMRLRQLLIQAGIESVEQDIAAQLQRILLEELHHRVKNTLATVQAITRQSLASSRALDEAATAIEGRLAALGRVHDLLLRSNWDSTKLDELLAMATQPFDVRGRSRFAIEATPIEVSSGAALPLAMAINELCTNASKYGALSSPDGTVKITAKIDEKAKQFRLTWEERGGPAVLVPTRRGFGSRLIEKSFPQQLQGTAQLQFRSTGVFCELDVPIAAIRPTARDAVMAPPG